MNTVQVELIEDGAAIKMTWQHQVDINDVYDAFKTIDTFLEQSISEMFVVVDLRSNPSFPLTATVNGALFGPYRNPKLKEWLIIGGNALARVIERTLRNVTRKNNVRWFKTEDEVRTYIVSSTSST